MSGAHKHDHRKTGNQVGAHSARPRISVGRFLLFCAAATAIGLISACGGTTASVGPGNISINVAPPTASVFLGATQQFQATVIGASNTKVSWNVNGIAGGSATVGTISSTGLYTAPMVLPSPASVTVTAVSVADSSASGSAAVTLEDNISVSVSPNPASVATGGGQVFAANVSGTGAFATGVTWSVNGVGGGNATVGTISSSSGNTALYTAPSSVPSPATVNVTATSVADTSRFGSASVTITCSATNSIIPSSATVLLTQTQSFQPSLCIAPGTPITWDVDGIVSGNTTLGAIVSTNATTALYSGPKIIPVSNPVTIHATSGAIVASATVTLASNIVVNVAPSSATVTVSQRQSFAANVVGSADTTVTWLVNDVANGSAAVGQICASGSNPCTPPDGPVSGSVDYLAPAAPPQTNPIALAAVSHADPSKSGSAVVQIAGALGPVAVMVAPLYAFVANSGATPTTAQFFATVSNTANLAVTWSVQSGVTGQGCGGAACGSVDASGMFTAPSVAPSPNAILITATSEADPTKFGSATIAITSGPTIERILPSSVMAGAVEAFPLALEGVNFAAGSAGGGSTILLNGAARPTTCLTASNCVITINPQDVQSAATLTLQVQNPGAPGTLSNPVPFVIVPFDVSQGVIALSSSESAFTSADIVVTEPTTAAESAPINVDSIGPLTANNCTIQASPVTVTRPASGTATASLCIHGNGLDPSFAYAFTGPQADSGGDIGVTASAVTGLFPNTIELDLQISSTTAAGVRTLFITTLNNDRAAATGMLEVK